MINRLESLELQGFKTFATLTRLEFPSQLTAIVGPNGSGKSNIADSIRWVLGEQSYSLLRAKRTDDMIFSGSEERSRAGMAATTITFNNEDGWLPIDYAQVSVSRRAYRDGQNEYLLNGQKVRLKDITEVFAQTGLSEMSYTIIGQGLVDVALALKPDERSQLFEEAAGIGLYRIRKEDALRRLEHTRKNLDRVLDILTEIKPRLRSLERQASRFQEFEHLRADLEVLLREWYGYHWHQKQQDLRNVRNAYEAQEKRVHALRQKNAEAEKNVENSRAALQTNRKALEAAHSELAGFHQALEQATRELAILEERRRAHNQQKHHLEIDLANVQESIAALQSEKSSFEVEIQQRQAEYDAASKDAERVSLKLADLSSRKEASENQLETLRNRRLALETEMVQLSAHLRELRHRLDTSQRERAKINTAIEELSRTQKALEDSSKELETALKKARAKASDLADQVMEKTQQIEACREDQRAHQATLTRLETTKAKLTAQMDVLIQAESALSGYSEGSKSLLEQASKGRLPQGIEPLSQHLLVDEKYERALGAALGELADLLIVPPGEKSAVIQYLESQAQARVALLAAEPTSQTSPDASLTDARGVLGLASDLVRVEGNYRELILNFLRDILIVEDRASALKIQPRLTGNQKAVTLTGLVFQANGVLISGQSSSGRRMGRTRQKNELAADLAKANADIADQEEQIVRMDDVLEARQKEHQVLVDALRASENERQVLQQRQQKRQDEQGRIGEQRAWHAERLTEIEQAEAHTSEQIQAESNQLDDIQTQVRALAEEEEVQREKVNAFPVFELQQELNRWQTRRIVTRNGLESSRQRFEDHQHRLAEAQNRLRTHEARLANLSKGLEDIAEQRLALKETTSRINASIEHVEREQIRPLSDTAEANEKTLAARQKMAEEMHRQVIIAERQYTQLQLEVTRRNDQLENLQQRIEQDFGLVSYDYDQEIDGPTPLPFEDGSIKDLPQVQTIPATLEDDIKRLKTRIRRIGAINPEAQQEYDQVKERFEFMTNQIEDLEKASRDLQQVIRELDQLMERDFIKTFDAVNKQFSIYFTRLFNGGEATLMFSDQENPVEGGVAIEARLPGRRSQSLALLSGGERSLTAVALIFALLKVSPTPFCILDEVDAMLDESNVGRFIDLLKELAQKTQFVIITHNRNTVQAADVIYGVTMSRDSTSQMISLKLEDVDDKFLK